MSVLPCIFSIDNEIYDWDKFKNHTSLLELQELRQKIVEKLKEFHESPQTYDFYILVYNLISVEIIERKLSEN